jgi:hypothetical protein
MYTCALFAWLISHQPTVLFSQNKPATSNQPAVLFSQNKPAPAISHQPTEQAYAREHVDVSVASQSARTAVLTGFSVKVVVNRKMHLRLLHQPE